MNVLITGSSGFIGSNLARALSRTHHVLLPTHAQLNLLNELSVETYLRRHAVDAIINAAVVGGSGPNYYKPGMLADNIRMFYNLVRCKKYVKRIIHIGSGAVYDKRFPIVSARESQFGDRIPTDEYGLYKFICSQYIREADRMLDLRVFGIFGEGEDYRHRFISNAICRHITGLPITMKQNVIFDYVDVQDFARIVDFFLSHRSKYTAYNIGSGHKVDLSSIAENIVKLHGQKKYPIHIAKEGYGNEYTCSIKRLRQEFKGYEPTPFEESLKRMYRWYIKHIDDIKKSEI